MLSPAGHMEFNQSNNPNKSFVERSMYKREMCKNWTEAGFCRYGTKCQYAHGQEELSDCHQLYLSQQKVSGNDKYKSQNCRQFYREKFCPYGKRCHFRHEYRSFKKIHRHFYIAHLAALTITSDDMLSDCRNAPDGSEISDQVSTSLSSYDNSFDGAKSVGSDTIGSKAGVAVTNSDISTDSGSDHLEGEFSGLNTTIKDSSRLSVFQAVT